MGGLGHLSRLVLLDGAMGTELMRRTGRIPDDLNLSELNRTEPKLVESIHRDYVKSGAKIVLTNTFVLPDGPVQAEYDLLHHAYACARASGAAQIYGCIGPQDMHRPSCADGHQLRHQIDEWRSLSVDGIVFETLTHANQIELVCQLAHQNTVHTVLSLCPKDAHTLYDGSPLAACFETLQHRAAHVTLGFNCLSVELLDQILHHYPDIQNHSLWIKPHIQVRATQDQINQWPNLMKQLLTRYPCIQWAGGCCGVGPAQMSALRDAINQ